MPFHSILFAQSCPEQEQASEPDFFSDLNLDQVVEAITRGREEYNLAPFFWLPLHKVAAVRYRHDVLRDLEKADVAATVGAFTNGMRTMRRRRALVDKLRYRYQKERWFVDTITTYCDTVRSFTERLGGIDVASEGLKLLREYLMEYVASERFTTLVTETEQVKEALAGIQYHVYSRGGKVTVSKYAGEADYGAEIERTFAKFRQGAVRDYLVELRDEPEMNPVEARVLQQVAELYPEEFDALDDYCHRRGDYLDAKIARFDREVQFYRAYLDYLERFTTAGLPVCYPGVSTRCKAVRVVDGFDIALAGTLLGEGTPVVCNDVTVTGEERIAVITGPNQGGKTTYARMVGQLHHLAALGLPVPARQAELFLPDRLFTHFEREETLQTLRGKLADELVRIRDILCHANGSSLIIMNESFSSTTLQDALFLGRQILQRIIALDAFAVYVTFVDELASLGSSTVSMVSTVDPQDPAVRTYEIQRKPADGLAYAAAIADKYGLSYDALRQRVSR